VSLLGEAVAVAADPTTADCLTASDASLTAANQHTLRAERTQLLICASASCPADIRKECVRRVDEVNLQIPTIVFNVKDASGTDVEAVAVSMDGEPLAQRLEGVPISIDPGTHDFKFEPAGYPPITKRLIIQEGEKDRRELVSLATLEATPTPANAQDLGDSRGLPTQRVVALVAGGLGVVGVGLGTAFGVTAISKRNAARNVCPGDCNTTEGVAQWSDAGTAGNISTFGFIAGGAALAGAAVLWVTAPSASGGAKVRVAVGPSGVRMVGTW
jgi:hypothetical protein